MKAKEVTSLVKLSSSKMKLTVCVIVLAGGLSALVIDHLTSTSSEPGSGSVFRMEDEQFPDSMPGIRGTRDLSELSQSEAERLVRVLEQQRDISSSVAEAAHRRLREGDRIPEVIEWLRQQIVTPRSGQ